VRGLVTAFAQPTCRRRFGEQNVREKIQSQVANALFSSEATPTSRLGESGDKSPHSKNSRTPLQDAARRALVESLTLCFDSTMPPLFHLHGPLRVEYRVRTRALRPNLGAIEDERQVVGGSGGVCALALAHFGARVRLTGNPLGDDSHGRFLRKQLAAAIGIEAEFQIEPGRATPYAILLRDEQGATQTLLSPASLGMEFPLPPPLEKGVDTIHLRGDMPDDYADLLDDLRMVLGVWLPILRPDEAPAVRQAQVESWVESYDTRFGDGFSY